MSFVLVATKQSLNVFFVDFIAPLYVNSRSLIV